MDSAFLSMEGSSNERMKSDLCGLFTKYAIKYLLRDCNDFIFLRIENYPVKLAIQFVKIVFNTCVHSPLVGIQLLCFVLLSATPILYVSKLRKVKHDQGLLKVVLPQLNMFSQINFEICVLRT